MAMLIDTEHPDSYISCSAYMIVTSVFLGVSNSIYNTYLPILVNADPDLIALKKQEIEKPSHETELHINESQNSVTRSLSTKASNAGYLAGVVTCTIAAILTQFISHPNSYKITLVLVGLWWLFFSIPVLIFFPQRFEMEHHQKSNHFICSIKTCNILKMKLFHSIAISTFKSIKSIPKTFIFLALYFFFMDGVTTMSSVNVLLSEQELNYSLSVHSISLVLAPVSKFIGSLFFLQIEKSFKLKSKTIIVILLGLFSVLSAYGMLGLTSYNLGLRRSNIYITEDCIPFMNNSVLSENGYNQCNYIPYEYYIFAIFRNFLSGSIRSVSRTVFSQLIPNGLGYIFFGLLQISGKGSAFLGPLIVGILNNMFGTVRYAFVYLTIVFLIPIPFLMKLDIRKGKQLFVLID